jgi:hypothetical protein
MASASGSASTFVVGDLSIHRLTDTIVYGHDLPHYIDQEFREPTVTVALWRDYA